MKNLALHLRTHSKVKIRQPLGTLYVRPRDAADRKVLENADYAAQVLEEANIKRVKLIEDERTIGVKQIRNVDPKKVGSRAGKNLKAIQRAVRSGDVVETPGGGYYDVRVDAEISPDEIFRLAPDEVVISYEGPPNLTCGLEQGTFMALDTTLTPDLLLEGIARDFNRLVQDQRKALGLEISDRISVLYHAPPRIAEAIAAHHEYLRNELLAERLEAVTAPPDGAAKLSLGGEEIFVAVTRI
jgi:isoleucyl-tRNA synthetase